MRCQIRRGISILSRRGRDMKKSDGPYFATYRGDCIAEGQECFWIPGGRSGLSFRDLEEIVAQRVTMENRLSSAGVVRRIALSDHWR